MGSGVRGESRLKQTGSMLRTWGVGMGKYRTYRGIEFAVGLDVRMGRRAGMGARKLWASSFLLNQWWGRAWGMQYSSGIV